MGLNHGGKIVTDGLVLMLDAANMKSHIPYSTFLNMSSWTAGTGGVSPYNANQNADENLRLLGTNPWGQSAIVWQSMPSGNSDPDGGWNTDGFGIDKTKLYRFSVWMKRVSDSTSGNFYFGINPCVIRNDNSTEECNPYWECGGIGGYTKDVWYLFVGHCFPYTYSGTTAHPNSGIYTTSGRIGGLNGCNVGTADVRWKSDSTYGVHRTYHFYSPDTTSHIQFYDPRIDLVDGTEPSIKQLWSQSNMVWYDLSGKGNHATLGTGITRSSTYGGVLVSDATANGYAQTSLNLSTSNFTVMGAARYLSGTHNRIITTDGTNNWLLGHWSSSSENFYSEGWVSSVSNGANDTNWRILTGTGNISGDNYEMYVNSTKTINGNNGGSQGPNRLGVFTYPEYSNGQVGFLMAYNRILTSDEVIQNNNVLKGRFGL